MYSIGSLPDVPGPPDAFFIVKAKERNTATDATAQMVLTVSQGSRAPLPSTSRHRMPARDASPPAKYDSSSCATSFREKSSRALRRPRGPTLRLELHDPSDDTAWRGWGEPVRSGSPHDSTSVAGRRLSGAVRITRGQPPETRAPRAPTWL